MVVDELHMVGDGQRGLALELLLTKLRFGASVSVQIIGMSATMGGLNALAGWLGARLFMTNWRPVPLQEHVVLDGTVFRLVGSWCVLQVLSVYVYNSSVHPIFSSERNGHVWSGVIWPPGWEPGSS